MSRAAVITISDSVSGGAADDRSGPAVVAALEAAGFAVDGRATVVDDLDAIAVVLRRLAAGHDVVVTTGGTGISPRDHTPEATVAVADYLVPGMAEEMRRVGRASTPMAVLSRGVVGVLGQCLLVNLPGSTRGATESLAAIIDVLPHALEQLAGRTGHPTS